MENSRKLFVERGLQIHKSGLNNMRNLSSSFVSLLICLTKISQFHRFHRHLTERWPMAYVRVSQTVVHVPPVVRQPL
jgi:hypothetical protein